MDKFEEWFKTYRPSLDTSAIEAEFIFEAGQQSQQAELDRLNEVLDERTKEWLEAIKLGAYFQEAAKPLKDEVDQLNKTLSIKSKFLEDSDVTNKFLSEQLEEKDKRIEGALNHLNDVRNKGMDQSCYLAIKALRGNNANS